MSATADREIVVSRLISAPPELVFEAFTQVRHLSQWWGPDGFTTTTRAFEFCTGGTWDFVMHGPDGTDYPNANDFTEVVPNQRIAYRHAQAQHAFTMTMTFVPVSAGTLLTWRMRFDSADHVTKIRDFVSQANEQNFDRLERVLSA